MIECISLYYFECCRQFDGGECRTFIKSVIANAPYTLRHADTYQILAAGEGSRADIRYTIGDNYRGKVRTVK